MKKIKIISYLYLLSIIYFSEFSFAAVWSNEIDQSRENSSTILSFVTTELLLNIIFAIIAVVITLALAKLSTARMTKYLESTYAWEESWREELVWVLSRTVNIAILSLWFAISLTILWIDMWIFLWGLWFGIGFTLKIFLTNFIAWILMVTQWFYHIWDIIGVWGRIWTIKKIHALFTEVEQFDGVIFYVPNVKFLEEDILNYHTNDKRRVEVNIWVDYETDILKAKKIMMQVIERFPNILKAPGADVLLLEMKDSSINLSLRFWINSKDSYFELQSNVTETINLAFKQAWINIPFPQITLSNRSDFNVKVNK